MYIWRDWTTFTPSHGPPRHPVYHGKRMFISTRLVVLTIVDEETPLALANVASLWLPVRLASCPKGGINRFGADVVLRSVGPIAFCASLWALLSKAFLLFSSIIRCCSAVSGVAMTAFILHLAARRWPHLDFQVADKLMLAAIDASQSVKTQLKISKGVNLM